MNLRGIVLPFFGMLIISSTAVANATPTDSIPLINPNAFVGRKLEDYPARFLVKRTKHLNIFWSSRPNCSDSPSLETIPDHAHPEQIQSLLENVVEERIENFEQFAKSNLLEWESRVSKHLYPLNIQIDMETPIICGGANQYDLSVYVGEGKPEVVIRNQLILESGGKLRNASEAAGFVSVKMHELGHLVARAVGYPRFKGENSIYLAPLEETIADFVGFVGNQNNPLIGEGLSDVIDTEYCSKMSGALEPFEKAKIEGICRVHSSHAMRDLRLPLHYQNLFKFPEHHHTAGHANALFYNVGRIVGLNSLFKGFMAEFFKMDSTVFDAEIYGFVERVIERSLAEQPSKRNAVLQTMNDLNWKSAEASQKRVEVKTPILSDNSIQIEIEPENSLVTDVFEFPFVNLNLKSGKTTHFSYTSMGDFWKPKASLTKVSECSASEYDCKCFHDGEALTVDAVYLDKQEKVRRTSLQKVLTFGHDVKAGCFKFGAE